MRMLGTIGRSLIRIPDKLYRSFKRGPFKGDIRRLSLCVVIIIASAMVFKGLMQNPQIRDNNKRIEELNVSIEYEKTRQAEIDELKDEVDTDEYIEKIAGEKLGLVKNNEKIFVDVSE